jgi:hypothetical protein
MLAVYILPSHSEIKNYILCYIDMTTLSSISGLPTSVVPLASVRGEVAGTISSLLRLMRCVRIRWAERLAHMDRGRDEFVQNCRCGLEGDTKMDIKEIGWHGVGSIPVFRIERGGWIF